MLPDPVEIPLMTVRQTAAFLHRGEKLVYSAIERGQLPSARLGRKILVPTAALLKIVQLSTTDALASDAP